MILVGRRPRFDVRRQWASSASYELPFGKGKAWLNHNRLADLAFGGWQLAGLISMRSGIPFTVTTSGGITNAGGAETFNFTNTAAFGQPGATLNGLGVGQITSAADPRRIQFGLKLIL